MADLLECLLQLKALADTPRRVQALLDAAPAPRWATRPAPDVWAPVEVLAHLADAELFWGTRLRLILTAERPHLEPYDQDALAARAAYLSWPVESAFARFAARRADTVELLESCPAAELERTGRHAVRGEITVADIVATLLAHDTDHVGQIRRRLGLAEPAEQPPASPGDPR
jgi:uncharacterized damage-inducible protein DinB